MHAYATLHHGGTAPMPLEPMNDEVDVMPVDGRGDHASKKLPSLISVEDSELRKRVIARLGSQPWRPTLLTVTVQDGSVDLWGLVHSAEQKKAARIAAEQTPGVRTVVDNIIVQPVGSGWS
jgi:osmotically-inducible protein OsmY